MRIILSVLFVVFSSAAFSQLKFPDGFKLIKGDNGIGSDDVYTNGRYSFDTHNLFNEGIDFDYKNNDDSTRKYIADWFGFPFHITKDSLYWGTGKFEGVYSYVVVREGNVLELYSKFSDSAFAYYSKWLISTMRQYIKEGKDPYFPMRNGN